jgi:hypothetical protein
MDDLCRQIEELIAMKEKTAFDSAAAEEKVNKAQVDVRDEIKDMRT